MRQQSLLVKSSVLSLPVALVLLQTRRVVLLFCETFLWAVPIRVQRKKEQPGGALFETRGSLET